MSRSFDVPLSVRTLRRARQLELENRLLRAEGKPDFVAGAPSIRPVPNLSRRWGRRTRTCPITGEHGTGKEIVAKLLHAASPRSRMPLVAVNAGGLPEGTFESEMFGHVKGAFTDARTDRVGRFELANGGTLFLDEIANVPLRQQAKLLRVLETGELERVGSSQTKRVDVRILSATNADLHEEAKNGNFREDLLFRINTVEIHLPPLRERREDIPLHSPLYAFDRENVLQLVNDAGVQLLGLPHARCFGRTARELGLEGLLRLP